MKDSPRTGSFVAAAGRDEHILFASAFPGFVRPLDDDLLFIRDHGVGAIVTLTQESLLLPLKFRPYFVQLHLPVENLEPPTQSQLDRFVDFVDEQFDRDVNVVAHCLLGVGRTGTAIAAYRVSRGEDPETAISELRRIRNFIETPEQEEAVNRFYDRLKKRGALPKE
ncbi:MAG: dual specificity protein phosphatase family protein [Deltaproteobacteria bacterium]|nr:dual specificity protein phosphatase family protein [Candidatus Zymogenaceae bacterium]